MSAGGLFSLLLAAGAAAFIVAPLLRRDAAMAELVASGTGEERDLQSKHEMLLSSLKDLEDDRATEKIDEADYSELKGRLSARAVEIMKRLDELKAEREAVGPRPVRRPRSGAPERGA